MVIDAHVHVWSDDTQRYPYQPVLGYVPDTPAPLEELLSLMTQAGVDRAVVVQPSVYGWDNSYLADCLSREPQRLAGVCLVDPLGKNPARRLAYWVRECGFRGLRLNPIGDRGGHWLNDSSQDVLWRQAARLDVPICVQLLPCQLDRLEDMVVRFPEVTVVIDHLAKPPAGEDPESPDARRFARLARYPNVIVKVAALAYLSREGYPFDDILPLVKLALEAYGPRRVIWGSDFPGILKYCTYQEALNPVLNALVGYSSAERAWVLGETAARLWFDM